MTYKVLFILILLNILFLTSCGKKKFERKEIVFFSNNQKIDSMSYKKIESDSTWKEIKTLYSKNDSVIEKLEFYLKNDTIFFMDTIIANNSIIVEIPYLSLKLGDTINFQGSSYPHKTDFINGGFKSYLRKRTKNNLIFNVDIIAIDAGKYELSYDNEINLMKQVVITTNDTITLEPK